jgi:hypothetical protein
MPALGFTDQRGRLRRILENALPGTRYESSERPGDGRMVILHGRRAERAVTITFRGVHDSKATREPEAGAPLRLQGVQVRSGLTALLDLLLPDALFPQLKAVRSGYARVRIEAGTAHLEIVCQDAEWWEEDTPRARS